jgi:hypothetical protein
VTDNLPRVPTPKRLVQTQSIVNGIVGFAIFSFLLDFTGLVIGLTVKKAFEPATLCFAKRIVEFMLLVPLLQPDG